MAVCLWCGEEHTFLCVRCLEMKPIEFFMADYTPEPLVCNACFALWQNPPLDLTPLRSAT